MKKQANYNTQSKQTPVSNRSQAAVSNVPAAIMWPRIIIALVTLALVLIGFVMVYSSSNILALSEGVSTENYLIKQLMFAVIGIVGCVVAWKLMPYHWWLGPLIWVVWGAAVLLILATSILGVVGGGAQRWFDLGFIGIQPSEFAKIAFLLMSAKILIDYRDGELTFRDMAVRAFLLVLVPLIFMYRSQSDLGTTLICFVGILMVMWLGEVPLKVILGIIVAGILFAIIASTVGYRQDRFVFLNPWDDGENGLGSGYQLIHSYFAFSEGGLFGVGLGNSREKFLYLPESQTDFIFAIIGEELGLIGAFGIIMLFLVFLWAGLRIAKTAPDTFGTILAGGFTVMIVFQAFLNMGCAMGVLPTTGKPLPFISAGGSSLIASLIMFGIIMSVSSASNAPSVYEQRRADLRIIKAHDSTSRDEERMRTRGNSSRRDNATRQGYSNTRSSSHRSSRSNTKRGS